MRRLFFAASIAAAVLVPSAAQAQTRSHTACEQKSSTRAIATVGGGAVGGVLGNVIAGQGDKTLGTIVGAVGGAVLGNQIAKSGRDCDDAYGYYDSDNRWHASGVSATEARGYYDRDGTWIDGPPNGRYGDDNRWIADAGSDLANGTYSAQGDWIPASANGYFDRHDKWVSGSDNGYYDQRGRWVASSAPAQPDRREDAYGYYDSQGRWHANSVTQGPSGYYDRNDNWVPGRPNGYYDERGNWIPLKEDGSASGSYDSQNRWIPSSTNGHYASNGQWVERTANGYYDAGGRWHEGGPAGYYDSRGRWISSTDAASGGLRPGDRSAILAQLSGLDREVREAQAQRKLSNREVSSFQRELRSIRSREDRMPHDRMGNLSAPNEAALQARIDRLNDRLRIDLQS